MRSKFDEQLALLSRELTQMGALCEEVIALAAKSITTGDVAIAEKVAPLDGEIDRMEHSIEALCLKLLLQQQPVARDLRQISAALKMITDMERIGDQASDIAEIVRFLGGRSTADCASATSRRTKESTLSVTIAVASRAMSRIWMVSGAVRPPRQATISAISSA